MILSNNAAAAALIVAFAITAIFEPVAIPLLRKLKIGQTEREEGVKEHLKKTGTPTMGGIVFVAASSIATLIFARAHPNVVPVILLMIGFGAIGFFDDYLKIVLKRSDGLMPLQKLLLQIAVTTIFAVYLIKFSDISLLMIVPFTNGTVAVDMGIWSVPFLYIVVLATVNGVNFSDGLDGLASSVTAAASAFFVVASILIGAGVELAGCALIGALIGFLCYNAYPAKVFMGDTGSLALGGFVVGMAYIMNLPLFIPIVGIIYVFELLSVALQVGYFKLTHGKRIFKMTPIHHHFELSGFSEPKIVTAFTAITIIAGAIAICAL